MAPHAHGERTTSQRRARTSPAASPAPRNRRVSLFSRPIPVVTPTAEPEAPVAAREQLDQQPQDDRPGEQVGLGGGVEMARAEIAGEGGGDRRDELGASGSAKVARHERDQDDDERHLEGREHPHGRRRDAEQGHRRSGQQRRQGWLVDVAERRVLARDDEVHLVAVEAVLPRHGEQGGEHQASDQEHRPRHGRRRARRVRSPGCGHGRGASGCRSRTRLPDVRAADCTDGMPSPRPHRRHEPTGSRTRPSGARGVVMLAAIWAFRMARYFLRIG